ncbi:MAG TPA: DUF1569 domain-containing protein [Candidatus Acidoferrales bacterium]|nr:DUF1569 domain-containing protein [Candidatus Acidoferrales bacterium]
MVSKNLFEPLSVEEIRKRILQLKPDSQRQWGKMHPAQMLAHCSLGVEMAMGDLRPPRMLIGRILGSLAKAKALKDGEPLRKNSSTMKSLLIKDNPDFAAQRERLSALVERFAAAGPAGCTTHPHSFFGRLTPQEWAVLMYKHLDHHLRQFGV